MIVGIIGLIAAIFAMLIFLLDILLPDKSYERYFYLCLMVSLIGYMFDPYGFSVAKDFILSWPMVG